MSLSQINHWIFDMDGTLTLAAHDFDEIRATLGLPAGKPILESIAALDKAEADRVNRELDALEMDIAKSSQPQPGAADLLETLSSSGKKIGILTRNGRAIADATLVAAGLDGFFVADAIVSRDCCAPKPEPAGVHLLLQRWSAPAQDAVMIGDYLFDLEAGHAAGTHTVHMDVDAAFAWPELTTLGVRSLDELKQQILTNPTAHPTASATDKPNNAKPAD